MTLPFELWNWAGDWCWDWFDGMDGGWPNFEMRSRWSIRRLNSNDGNDSRSKHRLNSVDKVDHGWWSHGWYDWNALIDDR